MKSYITHLGARVIIRSRFPIDKNKNKKLRIFRYSCPPRKMASLHWRHPSFNGKSISYLRLEILSLFLFSFNLNFNTQIKPVNVCRDINNSMRFTCAYMTKVGVELDPTWKFRPTALLLPRAHKF